MKKNVDRELGSKAVVIGITLIFIFGAFMPAIGSQVRSTVTSQSSEKINNGIEESLGSSGYIIDHDVNQIGDDQLNSEDQVDILNQPLDQIGDNPGPMPLGASDPWWNIDWQYRKLFVINHTLVDANSYLTNFPVLINISDTNLSDHAQFDGDDIAFTDDSGNQLHHEIEFYNGNTGELVAWVNVTTLSGDEDTKLYLYYGNADVDNQENPSGVWDSSYRMVQHLPHNWIPYSGNPVFSSGTFASVLKVDDTYHMYYYYGGLTGHATSSDGKSWTDDTANNPVLEPTEPWEGSNADVAWVWKEGDTWYMMYRGGNPTNGSDATGLATSSDGINWTKHPSNPVLEGEGGKWDAGGAEMWGTIKVNDTYYTYYECSYSGSRHIGVAWSTDLVNWTKDPSNPIMDGLGPYDTGVGRYEPCVFKYGDYFYMLVPHYMSGTNYARIELYRDSSPTFHPGDRVYLGGVKPVAHSGWDSHDQDTPCVLTDNIYRDSFDLTNGELWTYHDGEAGPRQVGLLISPSIPQALKGAMRDSTIFENHGDSGGVGGPVPQFSIIGGGCNFDSDEYMVVSDSYSLDISNNITMETWVRLDTVLTSQPNNYSGIISKKEGGSGYGLWFNCTDSKLVVSIGTVNVSVDVGGYDWTEWHHITASYDGSTINIYINSSLMKSESISEVIGVNDVDLWIGDLVHDIGNILDGSIDEVRILDSVRSWNWVNTSYNNQINPDAFYDLQGEEVAVAPIISDENPVNNAVNVSPSLAQLSFKLIDMQSDPMNYTIEISPFIGSGSANGVPNGTYNVSISGLDFNTTYTWFVNVTDGTHWARKTYCFTTKSGKPVISDESSEDGSVGVDLNPTLQVTITDYEGDTVNWYIQSNATNTWQTIDNGTLPVGNGTISATPTTMNSYNTTYWWSVNCTDGHSWVNKTFSFTTKLTPAPWWNNNWRCRKTITLNCSMIDVDLSNFPVLIDIIDSDLASHAQPDGDDIVFRDYYGNQYYHEIELYDSGHLVAWVNVSSLSSENTTLYMYYGNPSCGSQESPENVWDSNFVMVQHLKDKTTSTTEDSTSNGNNGTKKGANEPAETTSGKMDSAQDFDGSDDYIGVADNNGLDHLSGEGFTYTAWIKSDLFDVYKAIVTHRDPGTDSAVVGLWTSNNNLYTEVKNDNRTNVTTGAAGVNLSTDTWYYVGLTRSTSGDIEVWLNGVSYSMGNCTGNITPSEDLYIGRHSLSTATEQYFDGIIDEVRLSNIRRSADWINTSYLNQRYPTLFYSVGAKETIGAGEPLVSDETPENNSKGADLNPTLQARVTDFEDDSVTWYIMSNSSGSWTMINSGILPTGNGLISVVPTTMNNYDTMYWWSVNVTDSGGSGSWTNVTFSFTTTFAPGAWWNTGWLYRKLIVIDHDRVDANSDLTNFPVLLNITDSDLSGHAQFDGDDLVFTDYSGTQLNHEIEFYNGNTGEFVAWVNVTSLSSTSDTVLYMYYGNAGCGNQEHISDVWDSDYVMVQHLPHNWIPYSGNPVFSAGTFASVLKVDDTYHMYYYYGGLTGHATSSDGKSWTDDTANNPVLEPTEPWEGSNADVAWVWKEGDTWYMMYRGMNPTNGSDATGLATSSDGINWTKHPDNPVLEGEAGEWDAGGAEMWGTIKVNDTYYTYYECWYSGSRHLGIATSTDLVNWTKDPNNPIMGGGVYEACVFKYGPLYYMLVPRYSSGTDYAKIELYRDTNPTFYPADREYLGPVKPVAHSGWDSHDQDTPCVLSDNIYKNSFHLTNGELWTYHDGEAGPRKVGLLISPSIPQALKGAMRDSTIFENHGDSDGVGGPVPGFCKISGGYNIDGIDEYMVVSDNSSLDINDVITMETWIRLDTALSSQPNNYSGIISKKEGGSGYGLWFNCTDSKLVVSIGTVNVSIDVSGYDWTTWHQITASYDGSIMKVYIDSSLVKSESISEAIGVNDVDLWIGDLVHNVGKVTDGDIDEIRISNSTRSWEWVNTSYNNQMEPDVFYGVGSEETSGGITVDIPLDAGWNLITVPVENSFTAMTLSENITDSVMVSRFDAENQTYKTYIVGGPPGFDFPIVDGYGYFVLVSDNSSLNLSGYPISSVSVDLELDWNMIGWCHDYNTMASSPGENITGCQMVSRFDSISQTFKTYIVGGPPGFDFTVTPGMGLFVLVDVASTWHGEG